MNARLAMNWKMFTYNLLPDMVQLLNFFPSIITSFEKKSCDDQLRKSLLFSAIAVAWNITIQRRLQNDWETAAKYFAGLNGLSKYYQFPHLDGTMHHHLDGTMHHQFHDQMINLVSVPNWLKFYQNKAIYSHHWLLLLFNSWSRWL